jgi:hypothetical protein
VADVKHSKHGDESYKEALKCAQSMGPQIIAHLGNGQYNKDDANVSPCRKEEKLCVVDEVLFE